MKNESKVTQPSPAPPRVEILEVAPLKMSRPLTLLDGHAYAAGWIYIQITTTEELGSDGKIKKLRKPKVENKRVLTIVRDDGEEFRGEQNNGFLNDREQGELV